jgi:hypothetical protein
VLRFGGVLHGLAVYGLTHVTSRSSGGDDVIIGLVPDDIIGVRLDERPP